VNNLTLDISRLEQEFSRLKDVALLIVDPITAYMGETDSHKNADVRAVLTHLSSIASKHKVAVLAVTHFNKSGGTDAQMKVMGSLAFVAAAKEGKKTQRTFIRPLKTQIMRFTLKMSMSCRRKP
jgi:RecA-family ATPase